MPLRPDCPNQHLTLTIASALGKAAASTLRRALGDRRGESLSLGNLSQDYIAFGQLHRALACQHRSLAIIRDLGDRPAEARALNGLGGLSDAAGRFEEAVAWYEQSLELFRLYSSLDLPEAEELRRLLEESPAAAE